MEDSVTYQAIIEKGRAQGRPAFLSQGRRQGKVEGERAVILRLGTKRFGPPDKEMLRALNAVKTISRLEVLSERILSVANWKELLS